ncbi:MAG: sel1 repeat family protein, partial [Synergistaceae bacterium]|nr:sel1 repeat family protein [Synergistaceae bacterium]
MNRKTSVLWALVLALLMAATPAMADIEYPDWFRGNEEDPATQVRLGQAFDPEHPAPDQGMGKSGEKAFEWYMKAAEGGYPAAQYYVGRCYEKGVGTETDIARA